MKKFTFEKILVSVCSKNIEIEAVFIEREINSV